MKRLIETLVLVGEAPHIEILPDEYRDFYRELDKKKWLFDVADLFVKFQNKRGLLLKNLTDNRFFMLAYQHDYNNLNTTEKRKLQQLLPKEFMDAVNSFVSK